MATLTKAQQAMATIASRHAVYLEGLKTHEAQAATAFLQEVEAYLVSELRKKDIETMTRARLGRLLTSVRKDLASMSGQFKLDLTKTIKELGIYEAGFEARALQNLGITEFALPTDKSLHAAIFATPLAAEGVRGNLLQPFMTELTQRNMDRILKEVQYAYYRGENTAALLERLRSSGGALPKSSRALEALVRTALQHTSGVARRTLWDENEDLFDGEQWVSVLDSKTSTICRSLDGRVFKYDDNWPPPGPPAHISCRSFTIGHLKDGSVLDEGLTTRFARDESGKATWVPGKTRYYDMLKQASPGYQDSVVGPMRGKLLRDGGLTAERFSELQLDKRFRPRTLEAMRKLEPLAFERAGI